MAKTKNIIIVAVIIVVLAAGYAVFFRQAPGDEANLVSSADGTMMPADSGPADVAGGVASDFLNLLLSVKSITLNDAIFSDPAFATLRDSSISLVPDGTEGRPNPFAPIGTDPVAPAPVTPAQAPAAPGSAATDTKAAAPAKATTAPATTAPAATGAPKPAN
ncbi:MAG: hypothetical protein WDN09_02165 [bacterium]